MLVVTGARIELFEAKGSELPTLRDAVNLQCVRDVLGPRAVSRACRPSWRARASQRPKPSAQSPKPKAQSLEPGAWSLEPRAAV